MRRTYDDIAEEMVQLRNALLQQQIIIDGLNEQVTELTATIARQDKIIDALTKES